MNDRICDNCPARAHLTIDTATTRAALCTSCAAGIINIADDYINDGMARFSAEGSTTCARCTRPMHKTSTTIITIGAWRRHTLCATCADPLMKLVNHADHFPTLID